MSYKKIIPFGLAIMFFIIATFASWYEGSELVDNSFEWKHSAVITSWLHSGEVDRGNISQLDYFVYSIKFKPIFPIIMMSSFIYIVFALGNKFLNSRTKRNMFASLLGVLLFIGAGLISGSPTSGAKIFMFSLVLVGAVLFCFAAIHYFKKVQID
ncbi:DUF4306 domain-containing protein [Sutcliffiella horikoshii]|uniref:DUF4306 domain-containing protein n=1 Tax=Sutcliffiella horikoshii TaxID=79883 RepID=A0AA94WK84_9BACI|nr:YjdJ family protein [Sutcliffiella horikoshii]TYS55907.1 DUF4306 domain-containing protein [Sutcliffiella horikoshii]